MEDPTDYEVVAGEVIMMNLKTNVTTSKSQRIAQLIFEEQIIESSQTGSSHTTSSST